MLALATRAQRDPSREADLPRFGEGSLATLGRLRRNAPSERPHGVGGKVSGPWLRTRRWAADGERLTAHSIDHDIQALAPSSKPADSQRCVVRTLPLRPSRKESAGHFPLKRSNDALQTCVPLVHYRTPARSGTQRQIAQRMSGGSAQRRHPTGMGSRDCDGHNCDRPSRAVHGLKGAVAPELRLNASRRGSDLCKVRKGHSAPAAPRPQADLADVRSSGRVQSAGTTLV